MALEICQGRCHRKGKQGPKFQTDSFEIQRRRRSFHILSPFPKVRRFILSRALSERFIEGSFATGERIQKSASGNERSLLILGALLNEGKNLTLSNC